MSTILAFVGGAVSAAIVILKVIAPRTANKTDDKVLEVLERAAPYLPAKGDGKAAAPVDAVSREQVRDHRDSAKSDGAPAIGYKQPK